MDRVTFRLVYIGLRLINLTNNTHLYGMSSFGFYLRTFNCPGEDMSLMYSFRGMIGNTIMKLFRIFRLQNKVVFSCFDGKTFGDNPKAVFDYMMDNNIKTRCVWFMYDDTKQIEGAEVVKAYSIKALYHQATAKVWVFNSRQRAWMIKRKSQLYIQTWHGGVGIKKVEKDAVGKLPAYYIEEAKHDSSMINYLISASRWNTEKYKDSFWYSGTILETGLPRSDVFFKDTIAIRRKVYSYLGIADGVRVALYAPTFRNDGGIDHYNIDIEDLLNALTIKWPSNWAVIIRLHPNIQGDYQNEAFGKDTINGSCYADINELIIASDLIITDYSSCMFDALEIGKKVILYVPDLKEYFNERGTYFDILDLPFPKAENNSELTDRVLSFDETKYDQESEVFLQKCGLYNDGSASKRVADIIQKVLV